MLAAIGNRTVAEGATLSFVVAATDADGDALTYSATGLPAGATFNATTRTFSWTPGFSAAGSYPGVTFTVSDGTASDSEAITITVTAVNDAPTAVNDTYSTPQDTALNIAAPGVIGNDTDPDSATLTAVLGTGPTNGTLTLNTNGSFTYTPNACFPGTDSFTYRASDGSAQSALATVSISVTAPVTKEPGTGTLTLTPIQKQYSDRVTMEATVSPATA